MTYPQAHYLPSKKLNVLLKFCVRILFCKYYFRKKKDADPDPYL